MRHFFDRKEAGRRLGEELKSAKAKRPLVLALPRGGVPVGAEVARALSCPLDTIVARKVGAPFNPEFAVGAVAPHDIVILDDAWIRASGASRAAVEGVVEKEKKELRRRVGAYRSGKYSVGHIPDTVIIVDDGVATGLTARAACMAVGIRYPKARIIFAAPVCIADTSDIEEYADEVVCLERPAGIYAIGQAYEQFDQVNDAEVLAALEERKADR